MRRLRAAGCPIVGRTTLHELAYGVTGVNAWCGTPLNPAYPRLIPGGSSSGAATAVAAGLADLAIGTDTGGSIRLPAACCGVVGLKPSFGRVSRVGVHPRQSSLDCVGPIARDVAAIEAAMAIICPGWAPAAPPPAIRIGWVEAAANPAIARIVQQAVASLGEMTPLPLPHFQDAMQAGLAIIGRENWHAFGHLIDTGLLGADVHQRLLTASSVSDEDLAWAAGIRDRFAAEVDAALEAVDVLALPVLPEHVPTLDEAIDPARIIPLTANCRPFNLSGHPAIALPADELLGRPVALQLVGRRGEDERLCAIARAFPQYYPGDHQ